MKILIALLFLITSAQCQCLKLDVILIGDMPDSVQGHEKEMSKAFTSLINKYELAEDGIKIGLITFNNEAKTVSHLSADKELLVKKSDSIALKYADGGTHMEEAFNMALDEIGTHGRVGYQKIIVMVSDGAVNNPWLCKVIADNIKKNGIKICSVLIVDDTPYPEFMKAISTECYVATDFEMLHEELAKFNFCL